MLAPQAEALGANVLSLGKPPGFRLGLVKHIRGALRSLQPDVIHTHQIGPLFYTGLAALGTKPLLVHTEHGKVDYAGRLKQRGWGVSRAVSFSGSTASPRTWPTGLQGLISSRVGAYA